MGEFYSLPKNIEIKSIGEKILLFNPDIPSWLVTNRNGAAILSLFSGEYSKEMIIEGLCEVYGNQNRETICEFIEKAIQTKIFNTPAPGEIPITTTNFKLKTVQLSISSKCNLHCVYCYATDRKETGGRKMLLEDYTRVLDDIFEINSGVRITLTGGEPLLNKDCFSIAKYAKNLGLYVDILTNGTLINQNNILQIKECFDEVRISVDGSNQILHEKLRGEGSYVPMIEAVNLLMLNGINYSLSMTVNRINISDVEQMAKKYGAVLNFSPLFPAGNAKNDENLSITGHMYYTALLSAKNVIPLSCCESMLLNAQNFRNCKCAIGDSELSISETGDVYPCHLLHYPEFLAGNIFKKNIKQIYLQSSVIDNCKQLTVDNIEGCRTCFIRYVCGGACRARAFHESGNIKTSGSFCEYEKRAYIDGILNLYSLNALE